MAETYLLSKLESVEQTFYELTRRLADPDVARDPNEMQRVAKARSSLEEVVETYDTWKIAKEELAQARQPGLWADGDLDHQAAPPLQTPAHGYC